MNYSVKDSGQRQQFDSGMVRDTDANKIDYTLVLDGPMFERWAAHLTKGAGKYAPRNWMLASGDAEYQRFRQSAFRHFLAWMQGETDEDHGAAVVFNINGAEFVKAKAGEADRRAPKLQQSEMDHVAVDDPINDAMLEIPHGEGGFGFTRPEALKMGPK